MNRFTSVKLLLLLLILFPAWWLYSNLAQAQNNGDITIDPVYQEVVVKPQPDDQYFSLRLTNHTNSLQNFKLITVDFGSLNESGGVAFIGVNSPDLSYKYSLTPWISVAKDQISVPANKTVKADVKIFNIHSMSPGGHYGAILIQPLKNNAAANQTNVELSQVISSLVLVNKVGGAKYDIGLKEVGVKHNVFSLPSNITVRFHNGGNVHIVPRGTIRITDSSGHTISEGLINSESGFLLPDSNRKFITNLQKRSTAWWPGTYYLKINYRYDGNDNFSNKNIKVFYLGKVIVQIIPIIIIFSAVGFIFYRKNIKG